MDLKCILFGSDYGKHQDPKQLGEKLNRIDSSLKNTGFELNVTVNVELVPISQETE